MFVNKVKKHYIKNAKNILMTLYACSFLDARCFHSIDLKLEQAPIR